MKYKDKIYKRNCPDCNKELEYGYKSTYKKAIKKNTKCSKCTGKKISEALKGRDVSKQKSYKDIPIKSKINKDGEEVYVRECPKCNSEITHKNKRSYRWAIRDKNLCKDCSSQKTSETLKNKYEDDDYVFWPRQPITEKIDRPYKRDCPKCGEMMKYSSKWKRNNSEENNIICNRCATIKYEKGVAYRGATDNEIKQMRATKAGFQNWDEYVEKYPKKQMYKREVWKYTYRNDLESLDNWEKRGRCGVDGAYQLDHIISINEGYEKEISAEKIGSMNNLRMIPWEENLQKGG